MAGEVISTVRTMDFTPPKSSTIINLRSSSLPSTTPANSAPSLSSCRHGLLNQHYLITWHSGVILVQVFEGSSYLVKTWTRDYNDINDVAFTGDKVSIELLILFLYFHSSYLPLSLSLSFSSSLSLSFSRCIYYIIIVKMSPVSLTLH